MASRRSSAHIDDDVPSRSPGSPQADARGESSAPHRRPAPTQRRSPPTAASKAPERPPPWRRNVAASLGSRSYASGDRQVGRRRPRGNDRSRPRTTRQPHVAHANLLVSDLLPGRAQDNHERARQTHQAGRVRDDQLPSLAHPGAALRRQTRLVQARHGHPMNPLKSEAPVSASSSSASMKRRFAWVVSA